MKIGFFLDNPEHKRHLMRVATPRMTSSKRKSLGLSLEEATSLTQLQLEVIDIQPVVHVLYVCSG